MAWWLQGLFNSRLFVLEQLPTHSTGVEIGVHKGDFSAQILKVVRPKELHLIDPWHFEPTETYKKAWYGGKARGGQAEMDSRYQAVLARFSDPIGSGQVTVHRGFSTDVGAAFADQQFDWVYIDGNHLYEFVKKDLELFFNRVKVGGLLCGDDYASGGWWQGGVKRAVDEFVRAFPVQVVMIRRRQFVLRRAK
jgi:hypothetical protein